MARLLISCDDYIFSYNNQYYFKNQEWKEFYDRYLRVFEQLRICNRVIELDSIAKERVLIDNPNIEIVNVPIFHGPKEYLTKYFKVGRAMKNAVTGCDAAVLRLPSTIAQRLSKHVIKAKIPYATEVVFDAIDGVSAANSIIHKILWRIIDKKMKYICGRADGVSCVTEHYLQRRYFSTKDMHFTSHYSTLSLGPSFFTSPRVYPTHSPLNIAHVDLQIGLHSRKGTDKVILALEQLKLRGIIANVKFAGEDRGNNAEKIKEFAKLHNVEGQVQCVGYLTRGQLSDFLDNADLFVLPTQAEGLPRVIIEAIAKGLPTITTPASGNPELISSDFLVEYSDVNKMAEKMSVLISDKSCYEKVSKENFEHSLQYQASILQERRDAFYTKLKSLI